MGEAEEVGDGAGGRGRPAAEPIIWVVGMAAAPMARSSCGRAARMRRVASDQARPKPAPEEKAAATTSHDAAPADASGQEGEAGGDGVAPPARMKRAVAAVAAGRRRGRR